MNSQAKSSAPESSSDSSSSSVGAAAAVVVVVEAVGSHTASHEKSNHFSWLSPANELNHTVDTNRTAKDAAAEHKTQPPHPPSA